APLPSILHVLSEDRDEAGAGVLFGCDHLCSRRLIRVLLSVYRLFSHLVQSRGGDAISFQTFPSTADFGSLLPPIYIPLIA
ncbi:MAG: hypothetical protein OXF56_00695, partial [Rhodobacteraceae bacterium]|nr:hypothetical protein [Paracoccaceae bacterium]